MLRQIRFLMAISSLSLALGTAATNIQVAGFAELSSPGQGQALNGVVTIEGTAFHPAFSAYALSFAYDPNPTDTWFPIGDVVSTSVSDSRLGLWETGGLTPGTYQLRLTVILEDGKSLETIVGGLNVGLQAVPPTPSAAATSTFVPQAITVPNDQPPAGTKLTPEQPTPGGTLLQVLKVGAFSATGALLLLGLYAGLRPRLRSYLGSLQNRRLDPRRRSHRRGDRS